MSFPNLYYKRTAAIAKACYICHKPTVTVLATIDTADFFYTCPIHLTDHGFATRAPEPEPDPKKPSVSPEEIAKVKQEWEEKQRRNKTQGKKEGQVDGDEKNGADGAHKEGEEKDVSAGSKADGSQDKKLANTVTPPSEVSTPRSTHEQRRQTAQTKDLAPRLPGAPNSLP